MIAGLIIGLLYVIASAVFQHWKLEERNRTIENAEFDYLAAKTEYDTAYKKLFLNIAEFYGEARAAQVANGTLWPEMPSHLVIVARGEAEDVKTSFFKGKNTERWYYGGFVNRLGTQKYRLELIVENGVLVGWKDLD